MKRLPQWGWLVLIAGVARFINLGQEPLWYDETFTHWIASLDLRTMIQAIRGDVHPPLFYLLEFVNVRLLGGSEFALRLPSAIFGIIGTLLLWQIAIEIGLDKRTAFVAGVLAAIMPAAIYYGQEARMYAMLVVFVLLMLWGAIRQNWIMVVFGGIGAAYSQNLGLTYVAAIGLALLVVTHNRRAVLLSLLSIGLLWIPQALIILEQVRSVGGDFWLQPISAGGVLWTFNGMILGWRLPGWLQWATYGAGAGASLTGLWAARRYILSRAGILIAAALFGAPLIAIAVSMVWRPVFLPRAFLPSTTLMMLVWAYGLMKMTGANRATYRKVVIPALIVAVASHYFPVQARSEARQIAQLIKDRWQPGDVVYYTASDSPLAFQYYLPGKPYLMFAGAGDRNKSVDLLAHKYLPSGTFDQALASGGNVWVIATITQLTAQSSLHEDDRLRAQLSELVFQEHRDVFQMEVYRVPAVRQQARR